MKQLKAIAKNLWKDESAQGATEYILLLMIVVAVVFLFRGRIQTALQGRLDTLDQGLGGIGTQFGN